MDAAHRRNVRARQQAQDAAARQLRGVCEPVDVTTANAVSAAGYAYALYLAVDANHNQNIETNELVRQLAIVGVNPENPLEVVNAIAPNLTRRDAQIVAGIDHELMPNFGLSASYTWRRYNNVIWPLDQLPVRDVTSADYLLDGSIDATLPDGTHVSAPYYALTARPRRSAAATSPRTATGITGPSRGWRCRPPSACRTGGWLASATRGTTSASIRQSGDGNRRSDIDDDRSANQRRSGTRATSGSGKSQIYLTAPKYQFIANGYYEGPWGVNFGANFLLRKGTARCSTPTTWRPTMPSTRARTSWSSPIWKNIVCRP